jgi:hypothetical protein
MAMTATLGRPATNASVGTTLTRIDPGTGVKVVWVRGSAAIYLVYSDTLAEGDALPANRFPLLANEAWPVIVTGSPIFVAAATGTASVSVLGEGA